MHILDDNIKVGDNVFLMQFSVTTLRLLVEGTGRDGTGRDGTGHTIPAFPFLSCPQGAPAPFKRIIGP